MEYVQTKKLLATKTVGTREGSRDFGKERQLMKTI